MDEIVALVVLVVGVWLAGLVLGIVAMVRINRLADRFNELQRNYRTLSQRVGLSTPEASPKPAGTVPATPIPQTPPVVPPPAPVPMPPAPPPVRPSPCVYPEPLEELLKELSDLPEAEVAPVRLSEAEKRRLISEYKAASAQPSAPPSPPSPTLPPTIQASASDPDWIFEKLSIVKRWLLGGNPILRIGIILLFIGLAFLLRYASEKYSFPVEWRYIGVALFAMVILGLGWFLRHKNENYALLMQGFGTGILYLTVFAAYRLHHLLSPGMTIALLIAFTIAAVVLAVAQNALSLACAAALAGFVAPILASSGSGNHVALFSYFGLLNAGILAIAWFKAWRPLNIIGFVCTFGIGVAWGLRSYNESLFFSTEPFLILFFLMYVAISLLFARRHLLHAEDAPNNDDLPALLRWSARQTHYLDGTLVMGTPIIGFGLQCTIVAPIEYGMAFSALVLAVFYVLMAWLLRHRPRVRLLTEVYLALAVVFGSLAIPLVHESVLTTSAWALEAAGLYWLGLRQERRLARFFALLLMFGAVAFFMLNLHDAKTTLLSGSQTGALLLGVSLLFSYRSLRLARAAAHPNLFQWEPVLQQIFAASGLVFLYLIPPLSFALEMTLISWAIMGVVSFCFGVLLVSCTFLATSIGLQLLGAIAFVTNSLAWSNGTLLTGTLLIGSPLIAGIIGVAFLICYIALRLAKDEKLVLVKPAYLPLLSLACLFFFSLIPPLLLVLSHTVIAWAIMGLVALIIALRIRERALLGGALALHLLAGVVLWLRLPSLFPMAHLAEGIAAPSPGFLPGTVLALAVMAGAWRLWVACPKISDAFVPEKTLLLLSNLVLIWGIVWWGRTALSEIMNFVALNYPANPAQESLAALWSLIAAGLSALVGLAIARLTVWHSMAIATLLPLPIALLALSLAFVDSTLISLPALAAWVLYLVAHVLTLSRGAVLLPLRLQHVAHVLGCWLLLGIVALTAHDALLTLSGVASAWRWLGWVAVPAIFLWWMSTPLCHFGFIKTFPYQYRFIAPLPVAVGVLVWFWLANIASTGAAQPLPYLPVINPLELGLILVLLTSWRWLKQEQDALGDLTQTAPAQIEKISLTVIGLSLLALLTAAVGRTAFHWLNVPWQWEALSASMVVQAGWSLIWALLALALMVGGNRKHSRTVWITGVALIALVVLKIFFVELRDQGGLARIVSCIGVGILLLIVGWFSPLPPRTQSEKL